MDPYIGKMLDNRYELLELIGTGGMANVYKAKCHRLNRLVAIKILKSDLEGNAEFRRRFRDESLAVAQLSHANIVSVYDVSSWQGIEYIVMELIDGITLKQYMERRGQMNWREAVHFITQILRGLSHAHSRGIIHRDIKPQNIMVLRDGSVKVADFGIACLASAANTLTQEALGSVHYISPEQAKGDRTDERSDIYSAGVVLYEMLTGRLPFEGDSAVSVAIQHLSSVPLNPREINPEVPESLELICMKAMNADLTRRYQNVGEMLTDLDKFRRDPTIDLEYIRQDLVVAVDDKPTSPVPVAEVAAADRKPAKDKPVQLKNGHLLTILGICVAAIVLIFVFIFAGFGGDGHKGSYTVPNILGYTVEEANELSSIKGIFTIEVVGTMADENYTEGQIVQQDPTADHVRQSNLVIQVYTCTASKSVTMPNLLGNIYQSGKVMLQNYDMKLTVTQETEFSSEYPAGQIVRTIPAAGEQLHSGDAVQLIVSKGPEKVTVIAFNGMMFTGAKTEAEKLGLTVGTPVYSYSGEPQGTVIDQSIAPTTTVQGGTEIIFTVSGSAEGQSRTVTVQFLMPEELAEESSVRVEFIMDDKVLETKYMAGSVSMISYDFTGEVGSASTVCAKFNGKTADPQVISF